MSGFVLKSVAVVSMVIDHLAIVLFNREFLAWNIYELMRGLGRLAFPIYCFMLVVGFEKTFNRRKYLSRLLMFAALSQLPYTMIFSSANYGEIIPVSSISANYGMAVFAILAATIICIYFVLRSEKVSEYIYIYMDKCGFAANLLQSKTQWT